MVGVVGLEPTKPEGAGFTVRCNCRYATPRYIAPDDLSAGAFFYCVMIRSSIVVLRTLARTTRLSMDGTDFPRIQP